MKRRFQSSTKCKVSASAFKSFFIKNNFKCLAQKSALYITAENFAIFDLKRAYHSQFGEVNRPQSPYFRRIRKKTLQTSIFLIKLADEEKR